MSAEEVKEVGLFICFEGGEGAGKTTLVESLSNVLLSRDVKHVILRDPGSSEIGNRLRSILLDAAVPCDVHQQALLYTAARRSLLEEIDMCIREGYHVLMDRWVLSTFAYQGLAGGLGLPAVQRLHDDHIGRMPDIGIYLNIDPKIGLARKRKATSDEVVSGDRFESLDISWHQDLRDHYRSLARMYEYANFDASAAPDQLISRVLDFCNVRREELLRNPPGSMPYGATIAPFSKSDD